MVSMRRHGGRASAVLLAVLGGTLMIATPALAEPASNPIPEVLSFTASSTVLGSGGGTVTFSARLKYASICHLSLAAPFKISGLPSASTCTSQVYSKKVTIPKNTGGNIEDYEFSFQAQDAAGYSAAHTAQVQVGGAPPPLTFSPSSLVFQGVTAVNIPTAPATVSVRNNSTTTSQFIQVNGITGPDNTDYTASQQQAGGCGVYVSPGQSCTIHVVFWPEGTGVRSAKLVVQDLTWATGGSSVTYGISGTGAFAGAVVSIPSVNWSTIDTQPDQGVFVSTVPLTETITNSSTSVALWIGAFPMQGAGGNYSDFTVVPGDNQCQLTTVGPGKTCTFQLQFDPQGAGSRSSKIVIPNNTPSGQTVIPVSGTGAFATATFTNGGTAVTSINFGTSTAPYTINVANVSGTAGTPNVTLRFSGGGMSGINPGDFSWAPDSCAGPGAQIGAGTGCPITVSFSPLTLGTRTATLTIVDNSSGGTYAISLTGNGG
jgi:hypothetical protein